MSGHFIFTYQGIVMFKQQTKVSLLKQLCVHETRMNSIQLMDLICSEMMTFTRKIVSERHIAQLRTLNLHFDYPIPPLRYNCNKFNIMTY